MNIRGLALRGKLLVAVSVVILVSMILALVYLSFVFRQNVIATSRDGALATINQFRTIRSYYTRNVVAKAKAAGMNVTIDHGGSANAIPLPATFVHELSQTLADQGEGVRIKLYSAHPFPNRAGRKLDTFAQTALTQIPENPEAPYVETGMVDGVEVVRVALADRMVAPACVNCHNSHPQTPRTGWKLGDIRGILEVDMPVSATDAQGQSMLMSLLYTVGLITLVMVGVAVLVVSVVLGRVAVRPIQGSVDEIIGASDQVDMAAVQMSDASQSLASMASEQAASLEQSTATVETMVAATRGHADTSEKARSLSDDAAHAAESGRESMVRMLSTLGEIKESSDETARIIKTIDEIAFQTNLLALNAAVEAARAGDAGRGFAVVAEEVRNLAQRSAEAARTTSDLIQSSQMRADSGVNVGEEVRTALENIVGINSDLNGQIRQIAAAGVEQVSNLEQVSAGLSQLDTITQTMAANAEENASFSEELSSQAALVKQTLQRLLVIVQGGAQAGDPGTSAAKRGELGTTSDTRPSLQALIHHDAMEESGASPDANRRGFRGDATD